MQLITQFANVSLAAVAAATEHRAAVCALVAVFCRCSRDPAQTGHRAGRIGCTAGRRRWLAHDTTSQMMAGVYCSRRRNLEYMTNVTVSARRRARCGTLLPQRPDAAFGGKADDTFRF
jgi:hypothetical protein